MRFPRIAISCVETVDRVSPHPRSEGEGNRSLACGLVFILTFLFAVGCVGFAHAAEPTNAIRVLIVTGLDYPGHLWKQTTPVLQEELGKDPRLKVEVLDSPYRLDAADLSRFDVLLLHFMNWEQPDPNEKARENLRSFVERGGGLVSIHFACGAFSNWTEYPKLIGKVWDGKTTHDPRGPFRVDVIDTKHPLTEGLASFDTDDELYFCLTGTKPVELLATARSKVTHRDEPMAFVHTYGKGRVFLTPLGHDVKALRISGTSELLRRACLWTARSRPP